MLIAPLQKGIVYIAIGKQYFDDAIASAISIAENHKILPNICIYTDSDPIESNFFIVKKIPEDLFSALPPDILAAYLKTKLYQLSPFRKTLFLDTDIRCIANIDCIWSYCNGSIAASRAFNPITEYDCYYQGSEEAYTQHLLSVNGDFTQYNTGVFIFDKCPQVEQAFIDWNTEWELFKRHENMAFNRLASRGLDVDYLLSIYNDFYPNRNYQSVLVHYISHYKDYL